jgi:hypothetical protein
MHLAAGNFSSPERKDLLCDAPILESEVSFLKDKVARA